MDQNHVITIDQEVEIMNTQMKKSPKLLHKLVGKDSCCIFRVPQSLVDINKEAHQPRIVSIGPYHHGNKDLEMIEEHKWRVLDDFIARTGKPVGFFLKIIMSMEEEIRQSYSESIEHFRSNYLAKMMVLDGVFLIELLRKVARLIPTHPNDPIFRMAWVSQFLMRDLLKIENQIPFFVLQKLFDESKKPNDPTLPKLILEFFNYALDRPKRVLKGHENLEGKHLLHFFRKSFIKNKNIFVFKRNKMWDNFSLKLIQPATKLLLAGVKFKPNQKADSFLDIEFRNGVLWIPQINIDFYGSFFLNCVAFEQCYFNCSKDVTSYVVFMGCLMSTSVDVALLSERKIIENCLCADREIAKFFNDIGKEVAFNVEYDCLLSLFFDINAYCNNGWNVSWAGFKRTYFESPWAFISALGAFILLSLAFIQTLYTVVQYYH